MISKKYQPALISIAIIFIIVLIIFKTANTLITFNRYQQPLNSTQPTQEQTQVPWQDFTTPDNLFSFQHPPDWQIFSNQLIDQNFFNQIGDVSHKWNLLGPNNQYLDVLVINLSNSPNLATTLSCQNQDFTYCQQTQHDTLTINHIFLPSETKTQHLVTTTNSEHMFILASNNLDTPTGLKIISSIKSNQ